MGLSLGKIVKADSHTKYVCQIYGKNEVQADDVPQARDYALGTFVNIELSSNQGHLVGLVYDTMLLNPDFASLGPRLSPERELQVFSPDYLNERAILVSVLSIGYVDPAGHVQQGVPRLAASSDAEVEVMSDAQIKYFHQWNGDSLCLGYLPVLIRTDNPIMSYLARHVLENLAALLSEFGTELSVLSDELLWHTQIGPLGGMR